MLETFQIFAHVRLPGASAKRSFEMRSCGHLGQVKILSGGFGEIQVLMRNGTGGFGYRIVT